MNLSGSQHPAVLVLALAVSVVGLVVLTKAADQFVIGAARLATRLDVSPLLIGAVVVGFGTSAPEMVVSGLAASQGDVDLGLGNIVGSNIANLTLILGVAALITVIHTSSKVLRREAPISVASCVVFALLAADGLSRVEGAALLVMLAIVLGYLVRDAMVSSDRELVGEVREYVGEEEVIELRLEVLRTALGLVGTLVGAQLLVWGATNIAEELGLTQGFVGLTLVAVGTSLPELVTAVQAARRREDELIVGNLLGSNIFNSLAVGGVVGVLGPDNFTDPALVRASVVLMVAAVALAWLFLATGHRVTKGEAVALVLLYVFLVPLLAGL